MLPLERLDLFAGGTVVIIEVPNNKPVRYKSE